jgi:hypothetical protein
LFEKARLATEALYFQIAIIVDLIREMSPCVPAEMGL